MLLRMLASAFEGWESAVSKSLVRKQKGQKVVWRLQRLGLTTALQRWASFTVETRQMVIAAQRVVARVQYASVAQAYGRWVEYSDQLRRLSHIGSRLLSLQLSRALEAWISWTLECQSEAVAGQHEHVLAAAKAELQAHKNLVTRHVMTRWQSMDMAMCFERWCELMEQKQQIKYIVN